MSPRRRGRSAAASDGATLPDSVEVSHESSPGDGDSAWMLSSGAGRAPPSENTWEGGVLSGEIQRMPREIRGAAVKKGGDGTHRMAGTAPNKGLLALRW